LIKADPVSHSSFPFLSSQLISSTLLIRLLAQRQMERFRLALAAAQQQKVDFARGDGEKEGGRQ
jgi:hypothetical protein